jgi:hypothetical protein
MKNLLLKSFIFEVWKQAIETKNPLAYLIAFWFSGMVILFVLGFAFLTFNWIMNPSMWDNVQFGIYDTLGT